MSSKSKFGAKSRTVNLSKHYNWPGRVPKDKWWQDLAFEVRNYLAGKQQSWGIPFEMGAHSGPRVIMAAKHMPEVMIDINSTAAYLCFLHTWKQIPRTICQDKPAEGLVVAEYELTYDGGSRHIQPVRGRFEVEMAESPGWPWLALAFAGRVETVEDVCRPVPGIPWGQSQNGINLDPARSDPPILFYAMPNPAPEQNIVSVTIRGCHASPLLVAGLTLYQGDAHPLRYLPRRTYRFRNSGRPVKMEKADIDLGQIVHLAQTTGPRGKAWLRSPYVGVHAKEPGCGAETLIEAVGTEDAVMSVKLEDGKKPLEFSLGEAFHKGKSMSGKAMIEVLGRQRQWMQVKVIDGSTGKPTPVRIHFSGARGEYLPPYGHHAQINTNWFEDYGADIVAGGRNYAYVPGEFTTDMPVGDVYVEIYKGFEYEPVRRKVTIKAGQKMLELNIERWKDLRSQGWVTADTHVHFLSPHTAWLEAQAEGINVVNLLASQWGRLFTNVGDYTGRVGVAENDTIVYVGTENRNHMFGHMSMLGTKGLPVYPMCCGGLGEAWVGDPDFLTMTEWALENKRKGGIVIRPHFPFCGHTEDPVPILSGLVDALEININRAGGFPVQEWYRYLNCGCRVAIAGGTDKMSAAMVLGHLRTYAQLNPGLPLTYDNWAAAVRAGRTVTTNGPLMDLCVEGKSIGDTIRMSTAGGVLEAQATAESFWPLGKIELVCNGRVVAAEQAPAGSKKMRLKARIRITGSGWIAARSSGYAAHPAGYMAAHTSPVYVQCGRKRAFDGPAAEHMLALVEGGIEYLNTLSTVFDENSKRRMAGIFDEARKELKGRLAAEACHVFHHGSGQYHVHGMGQKEDHRHL